MVIARDSNVRVASILTSFSKRHHHMVLRRRRRSGIQAVMIFPSELVSGVLQTVRYRIVLTRLLPRLLLKGIYITNITVQYRESNSESPQSQSPPSSLWPLKVFCTGTSNHATTTTSRRVVIIPWNVSSRGSKTLILVSQNPSSLLRRVN